MVSTAQILAERALQVSCGRQCVEWAIGLLESGHEGIPICRLSAHLPPHNHFELASLRDLILCELGLIETSIEDSITMYAAELLEAADNGQSDVDTAIAEVKDLCIANDYQSNIYDFYALYFARADLREQNFQYYYPDADRSNIDEVTRKRVREFVAEQRHRGITKRSTGAADNAGF
jgi:hypothetical protein